MKSGQAFSIETVVIAALALIVLIVIVLIFTGKIGEFSKQSESCTIKGGTCIPHQEPCTLPGYDYQCPSTEEHCCLKT